MNVKICGSLLMIRVDLFSVIKDFPFSRRCFNEVLSLTASLSFTIQSVPFARSINECCYFNVAVVLCLLFCRANEERHNQMLPNFLQLYTYFCENLAVFLLNTFGDSWWNCAQNFLNIQKDRFSKFLRKFVFYSKKFGNARIFAQRTYAIDIWICNGYVASWSLVSQQI